jgi:predicted nucleic acid-binding protein
VTQAYLLPAQTLLDLCAEEETPAQRWRVDTSQLRVSIVSIAQARAAIDQVEDSQIRQRMQRDFEELLEGLEADGGPPLEFGDGAARIWQTLMHDANLKGVPQIDRQVYATALHERIAVAEEPRRTHEVMATLGLDVVVLSETNFPRE